MSDELREGEALELAIADAEKKARGFRQTADTAQADAEKWEGVAAQLRQARELTRAPAGRKFVPPGAPSVVPTEKKRKPSGYWTEKVHSFVAQYFLSHQSGPSKHKVLEALKAEDPGAHMSIWAAINRSIENGSLKFRGPDCLYIPAHDPMAAVAS